MAVKKTSNFIYCPAEDKCEKLRPTKEKAVVSPIKIEGTIKDLFGADYPKNFSRNERIVIGLTFNDNVFNQDDLDRFFPADMKQVFARYLLFYIKYFAAKDKNSGVLSPEEAKEFQNWFRTVDSKKDPLATLGIKLWCYDKYKTYDTEKCPGDKCKYSCSPMKIDTERLLIVTHATYRVYRDNAAKDGIDGAVKDAKNKGIPVAYVVDNSYLTYPDDVRPNYWIKSMHGEHNISFGGKIVRLVGGGFYKCLTRSILHLLENLRSKDLTIEIPTNGTYVQTSLNRPAEISKGSENGKLFAIALRDFLRMKKDPWGQMITFAKILNHLVESKFNVKLQWHSGKTVKQADITPQNLSKQTITIRFI